MTKKCLIIGSGESKNLVTDMEFNGDIISCHGILHKNTNIVCSSDTSKFKDKELKAIENNIKLVIGIHIFHKKKQIPEEYHSKIEFYECKHILTSGIMAIEWAIKQGYDVIYTAGLDFYNQNLHIKIENKIKEVITEWVNEGINIYKVDEKSILPIEIKLPK